MRGAERGRAAYRPHAAFAAVELDVDVLRIIREGRSFPAAGQYCGNDDDVVDVLDGVRCVLARDTDGFKCEFSALTLGVRSGWSYEVGEAGGGRHAGYRERVNKDGVVEVGLKGDCLSMAAAASSDTF